MRTSAKKSQSKRNPRYLNHRAFWRLKPYIDKTYPPGHYIGIVEGKIVADDADFAMLDAKLSVIEKRRDHTMVMQAGVNYIREAIDWRYRRCCCSSYKSLSLVSNRNSACRNSRYKLWAR